MQLLKRGKVITHVEIEGALRNWMSELGWVKNLYLDIQHVLKIAPECKVVAYHHIPGHGRGFETVIDETIVILNLIKELDWEPGDLDTEVVKECLTIHSLLTGEMIAESAFIVTSDFPLIYQIITGEFPNAEFS